MTGGMYGQTPTTRVVITESHVMGSSRVGGRTTNQPFFLKGKTNQISKAFMPDAYTQWWARCHGGYSARTPNGNPSGALATIAHLEEGLDECDAAPARLFPAYKETARFNMATTAWRAPEGVFDEEEALQDLIDEFETMDEDEDDDEDDDDEDDEDEDDDGDNEEATDVPDYTSYSHQQLKQVLRGMRLKAGGPRNTVLKRIYSALILIKKRATQGKKLTAKDRKWLNAIK